jgi:hypothetical protein
MVGGSTRIFFEDFAEVAGIVISYFLSHLRYTAKGLLKHLPGLLYADFGNVLHQRAIHLLLEETAKIERAKMNCLGYLLYG